MINIKNKALHDQAPTYLSISACSNIPLPMPTSAFSAPATKPSCFRFSHFASPHTTQKTSTFLLTQLIFIAPFRSRLRDTLPQRTLPHLLDSVNSPLKNLKLQFDICVYLVLFILQNIIYEPCPVLDTLNTAVNNGIYAANIQLKEAGNNHYSAYYNVKL